MACASPQSADQHFTVLEVRSGKGPKPPYKVLGLTSADPVEAIRQLSDAIRVGIKDVRPLSDDGYYYGIPALDGLPTYVRARLLRVGEVASMVTSTLDRT